MPERKPKDPMERAAALRAQAALIEQAEKKKLHKADTKRKIVIGGTVLAMMQDDPELRARVIGKLREMTADRPADKSAVKDLIDGDHAHRKGHDARSEPPV